jgi:hypothetical protein
MLDFGVEFDEDDLEVAARLEKMAKDYDRIREADKEAKRARAG